jgi:DNA polymerase III sliding clamp (beta) subunit (PCNA family)
MCHFRLSLTRRAVRVSMLAMPVLANVLLAARDNTLSITGTDLEVELVASTSVSVGA